MSTLIVNTHSCNDDFTIVPNALIRTQSLTPKAKMVLIWLLSHQSNRWNLNIKSVSTQLGMGKDALVSCTKQLQQQQYLFIQRHSNGYTEWFISDHPTTLEQIRKNIAIKLEQAKALIQSNLPHSENPNKAKKPHSENPNTENPNTENPTVLRKLNIQEDKKIKNIANSTNSEKFNLSDFIKIANQLGCQNPQSEYERFMAHHELKGTGYKQKAKWELLTKQWLSSPYNQAQKQSNQPQQMPTFEKISQRLNSGYYPSINALSAQERAIYEQGA